MSEIIVSPGQVSTGPLGLSIVGEGAVRASQTTLSAPVLVTGSSLDDTIQTTQPKSTTIYQINSGAGNDTISGGARNDALSGGDGEDTILGNAGDDQIDGGAQADVIFGGAGDDVIQAGDGIDLVYGGAGNDTLRGGQGNDTLMAGPGDDIIFGDEGNDSLVGNEGDDDLFGGSGSDFLRGGSGNDILEGGPGRDILKGGPGKDTFVFGPGSVGTSVGQLDEIVDFKPGEDEIKLSRALLPGSGLGSEIGAANFAVVEKIGSGMASGVALVYEQSTGIVYYNAPGGKDVPLFQMQPNLTGLKASDFTLT